MPPGDVHGVVLAVSELLREGFDHSLVELAQDLLRRGAGALIQIHLRPFLGRRLLRNEGDLRCFVVLDLQKHPPLFGRVVLLLGPIPLHELLRQGLGLAIPEVPEEMLARDCAFVDHVSCPSVMHIAGVALVRVGLLDLSLLVKKPIKFVLLLDLIPHERDLTQIAPQVVLSRLSIHFKHRIPSLQVL